VRQGDPLSPILLNIVVDMLAILISWAKEDEQIQGVVPHLVDDSLLVFQYADDTIIFMDNDLEGAKTWSSYFVLLNSYEDSGSISIRMNCFVTEQQKLIKMSMHKFLGVMQGRSHLDI
jgi:hypothetical protein